MLLLVVNSFTKPPTKGRRGSSAPTSGEEHPHANITQADERAKDQAACACARLTVPLHHGLVQSTSIATSNGQWAMGVQTLGLQWTLERARTTAAGYAGPQGQYLQWRCHGGWVGGSLVGWWVWCVCMWVCVRVAVGEHIASCG